mgnify:FL=1
MHPKKKIKVEIAYALSTRTETVGNIERTINEPRYITYKGEKFSFKEDIDKALWMYLHPMNKFSPLRDADSKAKSGFEFIDVGKRTKARMTEMSGLRKALDHAEHIDDYNLVIMAKGLGFGGVDSKDPEELRADLMSFATNPRTDRKSVV